MTFRPTLVLTAVAALALPGAAAAHSPVRAPAKAACVAERDAMGVAAFQAKYANENGRRAMRRCVRLRVRTARRECRAERRADRPAFRAEYGKRRKGLRACTVARLAQ